MSLSAGTSVRSIDNPTREGVVTSAAPRVRPSGTQVQVKWADGGVDYYAEDELESTDTISSVDPFELIRQGRFGRSADLRRSLTFVHLTGRLANLIYSLGITDTDFYPHQYRPLLTLLDSPTHGILIADEVGLGKTIEAGLIWTELRARFEMRRLLVVCPAMLREKWRDELAKRFGVDAQIVDAKTLLDGVKQPRQAMGEGRAWIVSYPAARPPKSWRAGADDPKRASTRWQLAELLHDASAAEPLFDLVVFDEAHYMRNSATTSWRLGNLLRDTSTYQVMLSATPINLHNEDLFNLLCLVDPDHFRFQGDFERLLRANEPLVRARDAALDRRSTASQIAELLAVAAADPMLQQSRQLASLLNAPPTEDDLKKPSFRAELADSLERLNLLSHVVTRTRKVDVETNRVKRDVRREAVEMTADERALYEAVTDAVREYADSRDYHDGFLLASPQRQVTSCPAAVAGAWMEGGAALDELEQDFLVEEDQDDDDQVDGAPFPLRELLQRRIPRSVSLAKLRKHDSKFDRLLGVASSHLTQFPTEKIVVFTTFRATARYLSERLTEAGLPAVLLMGGLSNSKQEVINRFRDDPKARFLISTEVAAEGVDLQFCRVLVNFDLPWNPTRIEQRIGRIDRLGQKAEIIHVWNLYFAGTIDERIVARLLGRLKIFEQALGASEAVVGESIRKLEAELFSRRFTQEEELERIEAAALALETVRLKQEQLERNAPHMMAHGGRILEKIEAARDLSRRVTEADLYAYVRDYLARFAPGHRFNSEGIQEETVTIQLSPELASKLDAYMRKEGLIGRSGLASGRPRLCRFLNKISASERQGEEIIHQFHPLVRFIGWDLKQRDEHFYPVVAVAVSSRDAPQGIEAGIYALYVRSWAFKGIRDEEALAIEALCIDSGTFVEETLVDSLLQAARLKGSDWLGPQAAISSASIVSALEQCEERLDRAFREAQRRKRDENEDRATFQLQALDNHEQRAVSTFTEVLQRHIGLGRTALARATQGRIDKLRGVLAVQRETIRRSKEVRSDKQFVCAVVVRVG